MGSRIAPRIMAEGHNVQAYDVSATSMERMSSAGLNTLTSPAEVAEKCEMILLSLPTAAAVESVFSSDNGILSTKDRRVTTVVDLSTIGYSGSTRIADLAKKNGITYLDAPVSGGIGGAEKGTLSVMVSGDYDAYEKYRNILKIVGKNETYVSDKPGHGQVMKVLNNLLSASALALTSEVVALGVKAGLKPKKMLDVLSVSSGVNSAVTDKFPKSVITRKFQQGFKTSLMYKDLTLYAELAKQFEYPTLASENIMMLWRLTNNEYGDSDFTTIAKLFERFADVTIEDRG